MKKSLLLPILLLICVAGIVVALVLLKQKQDQSILLLRESGNVAYKNPTSTEYQTVTQDQTEVENGAYVKTGDGSGHVLLPDNSLISLDKNTEIQVNYQPNSIDIVQLVGRTWHRVVNVTSGAYKVNTPTALATVRGTIFGIEVGENTQVYVMESKVGTQQKLDNGLSDEDLLTEGKIGTVQPFKKHKGINIGNVDGNLTNSLWYRKNKLKDVDFRKLSRQQILDRIFPAKPAFSFIIRSQGTASLDFTLNQDVCAESEKIDTYLDTKQQEFAAKHIAFQNKDLLMQFKQKFDESCMDNVITKDELDQLKAILSTGGTVFENLQQK